MNSTGNFLVNTDHINRSIENIKKFKPEDVEMLQEVYEICLFGNVDPRIIAAMEAKLQELGSDKFIHGPAEDSTTAEKVMRIISSKRTDDVERKYEVFKFDQVFETEEELLASGLMERIWEGFQGMHTQIAVWKRFKFIRAFTVKRDPKNNFGRDFDLYRFYETDEGLKLVKKIEIHACIDNSPMREAWIYPDSMIFTEHYYQKSAQSRRILASAGVVVC